MTTTLSFKIRCIKNQIAACWREIKKGVVSYVDSLVCLEGQLEKLEQQVKQEIRNMSIKKGGIFRPSNGGFLRQRVDFKNPETQKAIRKLVDFLKANPYEFELESGETYQSVAEDVIVEVIKENTFIVSNTPLNESIFSKALQLLNSIPEDESWQATEVSEPDTEDAYHYIESLKFQGSEKQNKWAKDIALKNIETVAIALKQNKTIPPSSKWWIENRDSISF